MPKKTTASKSKATKTTSRKTKASTKTRKASKSSSKASKKKSDSKPEAGDQEVTIDRRREDSTGSDAPKVERRKKVQRRRQIDPTTCERDYTDGEVEFMNALDEYKRTSGRMFPTCSEVLEVIRGLGYVQLTPAEKAARGADEENQQEESQDAEQGENEDELELVGSVEGEF